MAGTVRTGLFAIVVSLAAWGCGSNGNGSTFNPNGSDGGDDATSSGGGPSDGGTDVLTFGDGSTNTSGLDVEPSTLQTITVNAGQTTPTVTFQATNNGAPAAVGWGVDHGNIGTIAAGPSSAGVFDAHGHHRRSRRRHRDARLEERRAARSSSSSRRARTAPTREPVRAGAGRHDRRPAERRGRRGRRRRRGPRHHRDRRGDARAPFRTPTVSASQPRASASSTRTTGPCGRAA